ncbi:hypothetical protein [Methylacidimicrobium tartarophylax]|uniref:Uncharacterized protein n=1 Tax=Methylacidimicrobium tartarophylax TaxID=1041768 RepID=A0A5E6MES9_9BACT|nr:hypothetical protein [Methylacidimicrobium tartarophylax]VVM07735.1 hypothetical protein MAMT_01888 [Methylacidimicrobium tartarophylax]
MKPEELLFASLLLGVFALAGGAYGSFFAMGKLSRSWFLLSIGWIFFGLQASVCLVLLRASTLHLGWKLFLVASLLGYGVVPPLAWSALERLHTKKKGKP